MGNGWDPETPGHLRTRSTTGDRLGLGEDCAMVDLDVRAGCAVGFASARSPRTNKAAERDAT